MVTFVTASQWAAQGQAEYTAKSSAVDSWPLLERATWDLPREVGRRLLSHFASGWENRVISIAGGGAGFGAVCRGLSGSNGAVRGLPQ